MGKPKGKSQQATLNGSPSEVFLDSPPVSVSGPRPHAADGHNVDGWTDEDIQTYNDLLNERAKLEKEKHDLEQRSSRHQAQRALLDENAMDMDKLFKGPVGGDQKFVGSSSCCLDAESEAVLDSPTDQYPCGHEICMRAKTKGVSWMEMDTIKYYQTRVRSERSQRMQNALRKQRDVELSRVKKDDDDELMREGTNALFDHSMLTEAAAVQRSMEYETGPAIHPSVEMLASKFPDHKRNAILEAAKANEHIVHRIRARLDQIRHEVNTGKVSPTDARARLDQANTEMAEAEKKNNEFRQLILDVSDPTFSQIHQTNPMNLSSILQSGSSSSNSDAFSQALNVMKDFFSASDPHDVQTAITDLRSVLEINGPLSPVLQKSFRALEGMLSRSNTGGHGRGATIGYGKARLPNDIVECMMRLRETMRVAKGPSSAIPSPLSLDEDTVKANVECIKVEDAAKKDMIKATERMVNDTRANIEAILKKIKVKATLKSPIPTVSDFVLDGFIAELLFDRDVKHIVGEAAGIAKVNQLAGRITSLVITTAGKKPENFLEALKMFKESAERSKKTEHPPVLLEALSNVEKSMTKYVADHETKQKHAAEKMMESVLGKPASFDPSFLLSATEIGIEARQSFMDFFRTAEAKNPVAVRRHYLGFISQHLAQGIWESFAVIASRNTSHLFSPEPWEDEKAFYLANARLAASSSSGQEKLQNVIAMYQQLGVCPGMTAIVVAQRLTYNIRADPEAANDSMLRLRSMFNQYDAVKNRDWFHAFSFIARAISDLYECMYYLVSDLKGLFTPLIAADFVGLMCTFGLAVDATEAEVNLHMLKALIDILSVGQEERTQVANPQDVFSRFYHMSQDSRHRCSPQHTCKARIRTLNAARTNPQLAPRNVEKVSLNRSPEDLSNRTGKKMTIAPDELMTRLANRTSNSTQGASSLDAKRSMQLRQVSVNVPSIQKSTASTSEAGNVEKESSDGASAAKGRRKDGTTSDATNAVATHPPASTTPASQSNGTTYLRGGHGGQTPNAPLAMNARELEIKNKLEKFFQGVVMINRSVTKDFADITGVTDKNPLLGINQQFKEMAVGHVEMAYNIARVQGYTALQTWLEQRFTIGTGKGSAASKTSEKDVSMTKTSSC
ncbi:hypothetical protein LTR10_014030 [Elasticomyces elasticus]|uniref:Uncharacterized protein n=1 Tax=Exophiala sideris TaxID=1016849 RepID=A0ABR0J5C8_9EURO|nr:hypothetical protein LTR10_014030 [Elasticomyces elasticus]KAK5026437.1 hypothetical protein LTS07_007371 [Exophiala sideris]KAK5033822.1 hypothetical protein LTR13_006874 [Exophiala sideris]KAK5055644.1 hypothetical protein LTR69_008477 [Exophiala sideris]KAK5179971.1 hypothetical protein LTR44_007447 [Eurotiomycetes sp. CCFEE 6388]